MPSVAQTGCTDIALPMLTSVLDENGWLSQDSAALTPGKDPIPLVQEAEWAGRARRIENFSHPLGSKP